MTRAGDPGRVQCHGRVLRARRRGLLPSPGSAIVDRLGTASPIRVAALGEDAIAGLSVSPACEAIVGAGRHPSLLSGVSDRQIPVDGAVRLPRLQQRRRAPAPPECGTGTFPRLLRAGAVARSHDCRRGIAVTPSRDPARSHSRGRRRGDGACGPGSLARDRLAPGRREITFGRRCDRPLEPGLNVKAITDATRVAPAMFLPRDCSLKERE